MGIGLTRDEYDDEQEEWRERVYRIAKAINETVRLPDRMSDRELNELVDKHWGEGIQ